MGGIRTFVNHLVNEYEGAPAPEEIGVGLGITGLGVSMIVYPAMTAIDENGVGRYNTLPYFAEDIAVGFGITALGVSLTIAGFQKLGW